MNNEREFMMFYHTSLRNIGLFTSLSFVSLGAKSTSKLVPLKLISIFFVSASLFVNYNLIKNHETYRLVNKHKTTEEWMQLPKAIIIVNTILFFVILYRLLVHFDIY